MSLVLFLGEYMYLRQRLPLLLYVLYIHFKDRDLPLIELTVHLLQRLIGAATAYTLFGFIMGIPFTALIPFRWHYPGVIIWGIFTLLYLHQLKRKGCNSLTAFTIAIIATVAGGWIYEIPFYHPLSMFLTHSSILYINGQFLCLPILGYELSKLKIAPNRATLYITSALLIAYSLWTYYLKFHLQRYPSIWFMRIPTCLFLLSLIHGEVTP